MTICLSLVQDDSISKIVEIDFSMEENKLTKLFDGLRMNEIVQKPALHGIILHGHSIPSYHQAVEV